jgi:hypothetical protein
MAFFFFTPPIIFDTEPANQEWQAQSLQNKRGQKHAKREEEDQVATRKRLAARHRQRQCWACRTVAAAIMLETLFYKFTAAPESVYIFSKMHLESWWRYGQGIWELIASFSDQSCRRVFRCGSFGVLR